MPSERKRDARSPSPRGPARAARGTDAATAPRRPKRLLLTGVAGACAVVAGSLVAFGVLRGRPQADLRPIANQNVLLVTIDTLRADALGCDGGPAITPALDRLAGDGVRFDFAHAHAVVTLPSHASILTGQYPFQHGVRDNSGYRLAASARTAATELKAAGYATGAFVSAFPLHSRFGLNQGFDVYDDRFGETRAPTEFVMPERPAATVVPLARSWINARAGSRSEKGSGGAATGGQPWFVWVHLFDPHAPYRPPAPFDAQYAGRPYYGEVAATDAALAPLLDDVRAAAQPTLVIVTSDHGEALGDHGEETHGLFAYESTLRIPLIIAELGGTSPRRRSGACGEGSPAQARHVDILPTILDGVGQPVPADLPGQSLLPAAERDAATPRSSYFEAMSAMLNRGWAPLTGVLAGRDKFVEVPIPERYDLSSDAAEASNLAGRSPERDRTLLSTLRGFGASLPGQRSAEPADAAARLRSLGYVTGEAPIKTRYTEADDPKTLIALDRAVHRGVELYVARQFSEAIQVYRDIISKRPDMAIAYRHLAFVEWEAGNLAAAISVLEEARRAGVTHAGVTTQLGNYLAESGRAAEAARLLEGVDRASSPDPDALNALGIAYARSGRPADAQRAFERMLAADAASAMALVNLGALALERGDAAAGRAYFERAVASDPSSSQAQAGLGIVAMKQGDRETAVAAWTRAVQLDPTNYDALYNLATTLARSGRVEAARPYLEQFVRRAPPAFYAKDIREVAALLESGR
jgi:arylsulfatase A-like enzyme/tetratricopeptide (TPR) repeat protein